MKKKSLISSIIIGGLCLVICIFLSVTLIFSRHLESMAIDEKVILLENNVDEISSITYTALTNQNSITKFMFQNIIDNVSYNTQAAIMIFDNNGLIITESGGTTGNYKKADAKLAERILSDKKVVSTDIFTDENGDKLLTVGSALKYNGEIFGGVVFNQRVPEIKKVYGRIFEQSVIFILIAMLFSAILFYIAAKKITTPIQKISSAVKEFSKGNLETRVEIQSDNELGELAENINHMAGSLQNLEKLRRGFISDVSHELRTPMTTISGFVEGILDGTIPEENKNEYLKVVLSESKRLSRLVTNLLHISRMESGENRLNKIVFDINELMRLTLLKFEMMITSKNLEIDLNLDDEKIYVFADKDSITQVLINLINNAVKFTPDGGKISLIIKTHADKAFVSIINSGHGIESEKLEHIWDRFYKADSSRSADRSGVGLGLYIVKRILTFHGEDISVQSIPDDFTRFTFTLSLASYTNTISIEAAKSYPDNI